MKTLHIIGSKAMGGAERWFCRFVEALHRHGDDVHAAVRRDSELARYHLKGVEVTALPMRTVWDPLSKLEVARHVRRVAAPVVQTYIGRATRLTRIPKGRGIVHIARLGGYYKLDGYRHAHAWVGNTRGLCDWLVSNGLPADRVYHIYNFIAPPAPVADGAVDALRGRLGLGVGDRALLTPGRFVEVKGHKYLIDALAHLPAEIDGRRLRFLMLGDGPLGDALRARATGLGVEDRLVWCGWQQDPAAYFQLADAVIFPSRDPETFGNVILEAWSYGKPLVATAFRGAREIARHGEDSWIVPCDDPDALAHGIQRVLSDPGLQRAMVLAGSRRLQQEFSETVIIDQYRDLYRRLTG